MSVLGWKELKAAADWWALGVVIGGLSGDAAGTLAALWPLLLGASLGGTLTALAAAVFCRGRPDVDATAFRAQEALIGEMADRLTDLQADVRAMRHQEKAALSMHLPGLERVQ